MSAETLRRAAALMRERAEAATEGPWSSGGVWWEHWTDPEGRKCHTPWPTVTHGSTGADIAAKATSEPDAEHIASWHPVVALAVADWLDGEAHWWEYGSSSPGSHGAALTVARAYLGEPS